MKICPNRKNFVGFSPLYLTFKLLHYDLPEMKHNIGLILVCPHLFTPIINQLNKQKKTKGLLTIKFYSLFQIYRCQICMFLCTDPSKCINDQTLRSDTEFCRTSLLKLSDKIVGHVQQNPPRSE